MSSLSVSAWTHMLRNRKDMAISAGIAGAAYLLYKALKASPFERFKMAKGLPFIGTLLGLEGGKEIVAVFERLADEIGDEGVYETSLLGNRTVVVCTCEELKKVLEPRPSKVRRDANLDKFKDIFDGVSNAEGADWKRYRRLMAPAFHPRAMRDYVPAIAGVVRQLGQRVEEGSGGDDKVNFTHLLQQTTSAVLVKALTGNDIFSTEYLQTFLAQVEALVRVLCHRFFATPYWRIPILGDMLPSSRSVKKMLDMTDDLIQKTSNDPEGKTLLSKLIEAKDGEKLAHSELIGNVITLFTAGTETVATTTNWALYNLSKRPDFQERLAAEAAAVAPDGAQTAEKVERMKFARAVWKESLRLFSPAPLIGMTTLTDIEIAGKTVPPDTTVIGLLRWGFNNSPEVKQILGDDLDVWNPERWFDSKGEIHEFPLDNLVFGHGSRMCLGRSLADHEGMLIITEVCRRVQMEPCEHVPREMTHFTTVPDRDLMLKVKKRVTK